MNPSENIYPPDAMYGFMKMQREYEARKEATTESKEPLSVIGTITDLNAWNDLKEIQCSKMILEKEGPQWIVTATIPFESYEKIANLPFVKSLQVSRSFTSF